MEAITTTYVARAQPETLPQRLADTHLAVSIADERRNPLDRFATRFTRYVAVMESGEVSEADRLLDEMEHIAAAATLTLPHTQFQLLMTRAGRRILAGDHAGAAQAANALFELNSANVPEAMTTGGALLSLIGYEQGRVAEMIDGFTAAVEQNPDFAVLRAAVANYYGDLGRLDEAGAILDAERTADFRAIPYDINWTTSMTLYGDCAVALGDRSAAATIRDRLAPFGSSTTFNGLTSSGALGRVLGRLDTLLGDYADADRALRRALDLNSGDGRRRSGSHARNSTTPISCCCSRLMTDAPRSWPERRKAPPSSTDSPGSNTGPGNCSRSSLQSAAPDRRMWRIRQFAISRATTVTIKRRTTAAPPCGIPVRTSRLGGLWMRPTKIAVIPTWVRAARCP